MTSNKEDSSSKIHTVQAERDLQANWEVDLAKKLEDYLLKICSGEITGVEDHSANISINFAEAALLLQGSVQVYSRKVEYLYNLVLHALDFLSQKRQQEQSEGSSSQPEQNDSNAIPNEENDQFWTSEDIPVEARNCIDASTSKDATSYHFVKPPANLVVLEGDCLDNTGDGGELESYLLASNDIYRDFILLDPCDGVAVNEFLKGDDDIRKGQYSTYRGSSVRKNFQSPSRRSGGTARKSVVKNQGAELNQTPIPECSIGVNGCDVNVDRPGSFGDNDHGFNMDDGYSEPMNFDDSNDNDDDDDLDPWKPLNPHEPGNLKVKPFRKVKPNRKNAVSSAKQTSITTLFPLARMRGTISPELTEISKERCSKSEINEKNPPLYEKLRESLSNGGSCQPNYAFGDAEMDNEDDEFDNGIPDFGLPNDEMPECMDEDLPPPHEKNDGLDTNDAFGHEDPSTQESLEDLCRSHLDALLANIAETENQTELAARVSSWKHKIEHNLDEQDSRAPFDIHVYGERILEKLSVEEDSSNTMSFADVVKGQEKHDVARTFSALLQLVNNGDVNLERREETSNSTCFTATNPFYVHLLNREKRPNAMQFRFSKKRVKSPRMKGFDKGSGETSPLLNPHSQNGFKVLPSQPNCKVSPKLGKISGGRCTPDRKRRRRSRFVEAVD
ncbi:condensin-2 complex subunit H2 [Euphorbia lathyris]|uniref:condensin-2 complex subunit H2 n=1 Tax=Euphorbia lathyris TaxID=212925 RepID=UPI0033130B75